MYDATTKSLPAQTPHTFDHTGNQPVLKVRCPFCLSAQSVFSGGKQRVTNLLQHCFGYPATDSRAARPGCLSMMQSLAAAQLSAARAEAAQAAASQAEVAQASASLTAAVHTPAASTAQSSLTAQPAAPTAMDTTSSHASPAVMDTDAPTAAAQVLSASASPAAASPACSSAASQLTPSAQMYAPLQELQVLQPLLTRCAQQHIDSSGPVTPALSRLLLNGLENFGLPPRSRRFDEFAQDVAAIIAARGDNTLYDFLRDSVFGPAALPSRDTAVTRLLTTAALKQTGINETVVRKEMIITGIDLFVSSCDYGGLE